jgi:hypothetical protein
MYSLFVTVRSIFFVKNEIACSISRIIRKLFVVVAKSVVRNKLVLPAAGFQLDKPWDRIDLLPQNMQDMVWPSRQ